MGNRNIQYFILLTIKEKAFTIIEILAVMAIIAVISGLGIWGMTLFRQTAVIEQTLSNVVSSLRTAENRARNNISSQVLQVATEDVLSSAVDGYAIFFDSSENYSLRYCLKTETFTDVVYNCRGIEIAELKPKEFSDVIIGTVENDCLGVLFTRGAADYLKMSNEIATPSNEDKCTISIKLEAGTSTREVVVDLVGNNFST